MPELKKIFRLKYISIEGQASDALYQMFDMQCGIDVWCYNKFGARGLASRIQVSSKSWRSFTIRKSRKSGAITEYEKRKKAISENWLYPYYTMQAYINKSEVLLEFAICKTEELIKYIEEGNATIKETNPNQQGQAEFYVIYWDQYKKLDNNLVIKTYQCL